MGFKTKKKIYRLTWPEGSDHHGLEVDMRPIPVTELMDLVELADTSVGTTDPAAMRDSINALYEFVVKGLAAWNLEDDDDHPVEPSIEALQGEDLEFLMAIVHGWVTVLTEVDVPLDGPSTAGEPSVDLSTIPVESLDPLPV